jgi:hypothetical protein
MLSRSSSDPLTMRATTAGHFSPGMPPIPAIPALRAFVSGGRNPSCPRGHFFVDVICTGYANIHASTAGDATPPQTTPGAARPRTPFDTHSLPLLPFSGTPAVPSAGPFRVPVTFGQQVMEVSYASVFTVSTGSLLRLTLGCQASRQINRVRLLTAYFELD